MSYYVCYPAPDDYCMKLEGKVVLITGASEGIGAACAEAFRKRGARLALTGRNEEKLKQVAGPDGYHYAADLLQPGACRQVADMTVQHYGRIDVLVNSAGIGLYVPASEAPLDQARSLFDLNFFALLDMVQQVVPVMRQQSSGTIVNISSIAGIMTLPWLTLYSASKHAVCALTDGLRMELRMDGIHAMSVCPGYVSTGFHSHVLAGKPPAALQGNRPLSISPSGCAMAIVRGVEGNSRMVVTPSTGRLAAAAARWFPAIVERRLERIYRDRA